MFLSPVIGLPHLQAGKLRRSRSRRRSALEILPDVPTMAEAGFPVDASYWFGLVAPAGTPPAVLAKLEKALADVLEMPDVRKRLTDMGAVVTPLKSKEFGDYIRSEITKWADVVNKGRREPDSAWPRSGYRFRTRPCAKDPRSASARRSPTVRRAAARTPRSAARTPRCRAP